VTHEAVEKIGGIGAVIAGLVNAETYAREVNRTLLVGPLFSSDRPVDEMVGPRGKVLYNSLAGDTPPELVRKFQPIERTYDVGIVYGTRPVDDPCTGKETEVEVLLLDLFHANRERMNVFKAELWKKFAIPSHQFEQIWDFEQYMRLAEPGYEAAKRILLNGKQEPMVILAHEYMGMPLALKAELDGSPHVRTVFYAHEVASVRPIVEDHPGHDTMFYNVLDAHADGETDVQDVFPQVLDNYKHPLVRAGRYCDHVFAVGDFVVQEMRFVDRHFRKMNIDRVYNGIPAHQVDTEAKYASRERMIRYAEVLLGYRPSWIFTHVCRPVRSKGLWRDLRVMHELEPLLARRGETAVFFLLGTLGGERSTRVVRQMERMYGWPVGHERGYPDLCGGEEDIAEMIGAFNSDHEAGRCVFVNQWGWSPRQCGRRMPKEMTFADIRSGTDLEFGLSIYEPFGISQFEPLSFGALCVVSNVCGCMGFARETMTDEESACIIEASFLDLPEGVPTGWPDAINQDVREQIESAEARRLAEEIDRRLPRAEGELARRCEQGFRLASRMSWERVVTEYFLPSLARATEDE
jgi:hypothetical protein